MRLIFLCLSLVLGVASYAIASSPFSVQQQQAIEQIIHKYLLENPEILVEVSQALTNKQVQTGIATGASHLFNSMQSPTAGNVKSSLTLVEFFDYQCPHCKRSDQFVEELITSNPNLRVVYKELPIFGAESVFASTAALAAQKQHKFIPFHHALMKIEGRLSNDLVLATAKKVGIDVKKLQADMKDAAITTELQNNGALAQNLGLRGTPAFVVGHYPYAKDQIYGFIGGAPANKEALQTMIDAAANKK